MTRTFPAPRLVSVALLVAPALSAGAAVARVPDDAGVVVEEVTPGFAGEAAGIAAGDVILGWSRAAARPESAEAAEGRIETPFDLQDVAVEQAPRGPVTLAGRRGEDDARWILPPGEWRLAVRPSFPPGALEPYQEGMRRFRARQPAEGVALLEEAARLAEEEQGRRWAGWLLLRAAETVGRDGDPKQVEGLYARAVEVLDDGRSPLATAQVLASWADSLVSRGSPGPAAERCERALELVAGSRGESLALARVLQGLAHARSRMADDAAAEARHREALALRQKLAPDSLAAADSLAALGMIALARYDFLGAEEHLSRAVRIHGSAPGLAYAQDLSALAALAAQQGDYATSSERLSLALPVLEKLAPTGPELAYALYTAGGVAFVRGDLVAAEGYTRRALLLYRSLSGNDRRAGYALQALSLISWSRRDHALAQSLGTEALAIFEAVAPGTEAVGQALHHLGDIALQRGDHAKAEEHLRRALAIDKAHSPDGVRTASDLHCLGLTLARSGRPEEGEPHALLSAEIRRRLVPAGLDLSKSLMALGEIARLQGRLDVAAERYGEALAIRRRVAPGTREEAEAHHGLGWVHRKAGRPAQAAESFERAVDALEQQRGRLGGTDEAKASFSAAYSGYYHDAVDSLVALGRGHDAFHVLERSRARSLLAMLAERDLLFQADLPPELARERRLNRAGYDRTQADLARLSPDTDGAEVERLLGRLRELRAQSAEITARLRVASPRLASLEYPEPLGVRAAGEALDPGTALLAFSVGEERAVLFALRGPGPGRDDAALSVFTISAGREALLRRVQDLRRLIAVGSPDLRELKAAGAGLYDLLLRPAEALLAGSDRLAISPDGPLHLLPFGALVRTDTQGGKGAQGWLAEWRPLHVVASATQQAELKKARPRSDADRGGLVAFGDPAYPAGGVPPGLLLGPAAPAAGERGLDLAPLPFGRREVEAIGALFGKQAVVYLGEDATEARAKAVGKDVGYVHFACHAVIDEGFPLNSSIVLTIPRTVEEGEDNGVLQAWEVFDRVRLDAEMVTLSGCETALGQEMGGEGLMSLARAFQYAGARSVLASLWRVPDKPSTVELMAHVYGHLRNGRAKAEALRLAQMELIRSGTRAAHPIRWAGFAVFGDWR